MPAKPTKASTDTTTARTSKDYETLLRQVSDRVWELWREDLRRAQERSGKIGRRSK